MPSKEVKSRNRILYETADFYFKKKTPIHIKLLNENWLNGEITFLKSDRLIILEDRFGEMLVLFESIKDNGIVPKEIKK